MKIFPAYEIGTFQQTLHRRIMELQIESGEDPFCLPVGLFLILDDANGGDSIAREIRKRFTLLELESRNVIDFYFLGWFSGNKFVLPPGSSRARRGPRQYKFDMYAFEKCREALRQVGITQFGGNADLILVDAQYQSGNIFLNFPEAIRIDLSQSSSEKDFSTLGGFLQSVIEAAEAIKNDPNRITTDGVVFSISDRLGLAIAKHSILDFFMEKFGKVIGGKKLQSVAVRNLAPRVSLFNLTG